MSFPVRSRESEELWLELELALKLDDRRDASREAVWVRRSRRDRRGKVTAIGIRWIDGYLRIVVVGGKEQQRATHLKQVKKAVATEPRASVSRREISRCSAGCSGGLALGTGTRAVVCVCVLDVVKKGEDDGRSVGIISRVCESENGNDYCGVRCGK